MVMERGIAGRNIKKCKNIEGCVWKEMHGNCRGAMKRGKERGMEKNVWELEQGRMKRSMENGYGKERVGTDGEV